MDYIKAVQKRDACRDERVHTRAKKTSMVIAGDSQPFRCRVFEKVGGAYLACFARLATDERR